MDMKTALDAFIVSKIASNRSERTTEKYTDIIGKFIKETGNAPLEAVQPAQIECWLASQNGGKIT